MSVTARPYIPPVAAQMAPGQERLWLLQIAERLNLLLRRASSVEVTLTPGAATTVLVDERIGRYSAVHLVPTSASAAAATGMWVEVTKGSATIHHDVSGATDRRFSALVG